MDTATPPQPSWPVLTFDEAVVREWLDDDVTRREVLGCDADLPEYPASPEDDGETFLSQVDDLVRNAADDGILLSLRDDAGYDVVKVHFTCISDSAGTLDGGMLTVDYWRAPHSPAVRFASFPLTHRDLIGDTSATGVDAAVSILQAVTETAASVLANAGRLSPPPPPAAPSVTDVVTELGELGVHDVTVRGGPQSWSSWVATTRVTYRHGRGGALAGSIDAEGVRAEAADPDDAIRRLAAEIRDRFVPGGTDAGGSPCALLRPDATTRQDGATRV